MAGGYREEEWQLRPRAGLCQGILQHWWGQNWEHVPEELASAPGQGTRTHTAL